MPPRPDELLKRALRGLGRRALEAAGRGPRPTGAPHVSFERGPSGAVGQGSSLLEAAATLGVDLNHYCGGTCSCGTCRLEILDGRHNLSRPEGRERMVLGPIYADRGDRLGCQARVLGAVRVRIPDRF